MACFDRYFGEIVENLPESCPRHGKPHAALCVPRDPVSANQRPGFANFTYRPRPLQLYIILLCVWCYCFEEDDLETFQCICDMTGSRKRTQVNLLIKISHYKSMGAALYGAWMLSFINCWYIKDYLSSNKLVVIEKNRDGRCKYCFVPGDDFRCRSFFPTSWYLRWRVRWRIW